MRTPPRSKITVSAAGAAAAAGVGTVMRDVDSGGGGAARKRRMGFHRSLAWSRLCRKPAPARLAGLLEDGIGDRHQMRVDALQVAQDVEMERAGLDRLRPVAPEALEMLVGGQALALAKAHLLGEQLARDRRIARHKGGEGELEG